MPDDELPFVPATDGDYHKWRFAHMDGVVVTRQSGKKPFLVHRPDCSHIADHMTPGALTSGKKPKHCFETLRSARAWIAKQATPVKPALRACPTCDPF